MQNKKDIAYTRVQRCRQLCLCILLAATLFTACGGKKSEVRFLRFEQFLFEPEKTAADASQFVSPLINYQPDDPQFMAMVHDFTNDSVVEYIYHTTDSLYHDLGWLETELGKALARAAKICPDIRYDRFYTLVTADFDDYQNRVFCTDHELAVSIDRYAVGEMQQYGSFGIPAYILALSRKEYIAPDCMAAIARAHIELPDGQLSLLDYTIAEGKVQYFLERTMPWADDTLRLRYTGDQMSWMKGHVEQVWAWLIENRMLYNTDYSQLRNFIDDAPKTNAFGEGSAPRTLHYIGWQIVKQYMKKSGRTVEELLGETDSQKILTQSGWRP